MNRPWDVVAARGRRPLSARALEAVDRTGVRGDVDPAAAVAPERGGLVHRQPERGVAGRAARRELHARQLARAVVGVEVAAEQGRELSVARDVAADDRAGGAVAVLE